MSFTILLLAPDVDPSWPEKIQRAVPGVVVKTFVEAELRQRGIEHLYLFGSTARGEARADSDVDLFFDHPEGLARALRANGRERRGGPDPWV